MPLNIQDSEGRQGTRPEKPAPPGTLPVAGNRKLLFWIFTFVVLASVFFLLIQFDVIPVGGSGTGAPGASRPSPGDSLPAQGAPEVTPPAPAKGADAAGAKTEGGREAELKRRLAAAGGEYAIFISAFSAAADAEELAGRWERAGYPAFVQHSGGWYRVALGRYESVMVARAEAEKLRQALEEGYWIGRASL
jgi:hypothetical protein